MIHSLIVYLLFSREQIIGDKSVIIGKACRIETQDLERYIANLDF